MMQRIHSGPRRLALLAGALAALLLGAAPARAEPGVDEPPLPGTPPALAVPALEEARLPNGVRVVVVPRPGLPLVAVALHLRQGSLADPAGQSGLASITHDLRLRGAVVGGRRLDATALAREAETLGSGLGGSTGWRGSTLSMTVATPHLARATGLLAAVLRRPTLPAAELEHLRSQAADSLKFDRSDPAALASLVGQRSAWGASAYGQPVTLESLARIRHADAVALHHRQLRPELTTLVMAGDVSLAQALDLARRHLGDWRASGPAAAVPVARPASATLPPTVLVTLPGAGQSGVVVLAPMEVGSEDPQRRVAQVAAAVLGGGYSARLNQEIRVRRGLSYGAGAGVSLQPEGGVLSASTQTKNASAAEVVRVMREQIRLLGQQAPSAEELGARQAALVGGFARQLDTVSGLAGLALDLVERQRPLGEAQQVAPAILAVTPEQVRDFAARHWTADRLRTVVVGDLDADIVSTLQDPPADVLRLDAAQLKLDSATLR